MTFNLGGFAEGIDQASQVHADLKQKAMMLKEAQMRLDEMKRKVAGSAMELGLRGWQPPDQSGPAPGPIGVRPTPMQGPSGGAGGPPPALPGSTPMPQGMAPTGPPAGPGGVAPMRPPMRPAAQPMPSGTPTPAGPQPASSAAPGGTAGGAAPPIDPNLSGVAQNIQDPVKSAAASFNSLLNYAQKMNPKADPATVMEAVRSYFADMKGLDADQRALVNAQIHYYETAARVATTQRGQDMTYGARTRGQDLTFQEREDAIDASLKKQSMADATRLQAAQIAQAGANHRAEEYTAQRDRALSAGLDVKVWQTQVAAQLKEEGFDDNYIARLFGAQSGSANAGVTPLTPPPQAPHRQLPTPPTGPVSAGFKGPSAQRGPGGKAPLVAHDGKGNTIHWNGKAWVPGAA